MKQMSPTTTGAAGEVTISNSAHPWANRCLLQGVYLTLCLDEVSFNRVCKKLGAEDLDWHHSNHGTCYSLSDSEGKNCCIVAIRDWKKRSLIEVHGLIVHEAMHVWQYTKKVMGEDAPGREIEAYAMQNITLELFGLFKLLSKKK